MAAALRGNRHAAHSVTGPGSHAPALCSQLLAAKTQRAAWQESELGPCADEGSITEGVRDLKVTEAQQQKVHEKVPRRTTSPEPVEAAAAKPSTSGQAQQQQQALHSGAQEWNSCQSAAPRHVCTMSELYMAEGYGCWWGVTSAAASSFGSGMHCKAQGGCLWWDVIELQGSAVPLLAPMHQHHPTSRSGG